jgi:hypothetical protein
VSPGIVVGRAPLFVTHDGEADRELKNPLNTGPMSPVSYDATRTVRRGTDASGLYALAKRGPANKLYKTGMTIARMTGSARGGPRFAGAAGLVFVDAGGEEAIARLSSESDVMFALLQARGLKREV